MRDGFWLRQVKRVARWRYRIDLAVSRWWRGHHPAYRIDGECNGCGRCCEAPGIRIGPVLRHVSTLRRLFVAWQRRVNGFEPTGEDRTRGILFFRCTHYDSGTKQCDSYESRPGMCRDYPVSQLDLPVPELFEECSYRLVLRKSEQLHRALDRLDLPPETRARLEAELRMGERDSSS